MSPCELLRGNLGALFECEPRNGHVRIRTPYLYPDGDVIDLYWRPAAEDGAGAVAGLLSDYGETMRWLRMQTAAGRRSANQDRLVDDVCLNHGIERVSGELSIRVGPNLPMHEAVTRLGQAALRVADVSFTFRMRAAASVADEVAEFLDTLPLAYERGQRQTGRSGNVWRPDFHTRSEARSRLVFLLATGSRARTRPLVEHVVAAWYDLAHLRATVPGMEFVSLFDDTTDVWSAEDYHMLDDLSELAYWSRPDEVGRLLCETA